MPRRLSLLGMPVDSGLSAGEVVSRLFSQPTLLSYLNPYAWKVSQRDPAYRENLLLMDAICCDGVAIRHAGRAVLGEPLEIISMDYSGIAPGYLSKVQNHDLRICLVGSGLQTVNHAADRIRADFPGIAISGVFPGYEDGPASARAAILESGPDLVLAGLGMGLQEQFLLSLRDQGWQGSGICVGAFFDRLANPAHDYPAWSTQRNLRYLGNITRRPFYYLKRYGVDYLPFIKQYVTHRLARKGSMQ